MTGVGVTPRRSVDAEDIRDLECRACHRSSDGWLHLPSEPVERAHDIAQRACRDLGIERRGLQLLMSQQHLDDADVDLLLQEMGGEAVPKRVQRDPLVDVGGVLGGVEGANGVAAAGPNGAQEF